MPEQITKYPDITLKVLEGAGAVCGKGAEQTILKQCPKERFCKLPSGEVCIYGIEDIPKMTQVSKADLAPIVCGPRAENTFEMPLGSGILYLLAGMVIAASTARFKR